MDAKKKKRLIIICTVAAFFITPLIVYALMYGSGEKKNDFAPAQANVQVKEGAGENDTKDELVKNYVLTKDNEEGTSYSVEKTVQIVDERSKNDEYLRVTLVPMWYDEAGNVCAGLPGGITDFRTATLDQENNKLVYYNGAETPEPILTLYLCSEEGKLWSDNWTYEDDGYFYYKGPILSGNTTPPLITKVELSKDVYDATDGYELHLDVLADAVQTYGRATEERSWAQ